MFHVLSGICLVVLSILKICLFQVPSSSQNSTGHINLPSVSGLEISRRSMSSTDSMSQALVPADSLQGPDSPQGNYFGCLFLFCLVAGSVGALMKQMDIIRHIEVKFKCFHLLY